LYDEDFDALFEDSDSDAGLASVPAFRGANIAVLEGLCKLVELLFKIMKSAGFPGLTRLFCCLEKGLLKLRMIVTEASVPCLADECSIRIPTLTKGCSGILDFRLGGGKSGPLHLDNESDDSFFFLVCENPRSADLCGHISGLKPLH
jgi:hypothetical protein